MRIGKKAEALIHQFEGIDKPSQWPGGASGITIPYGYDLGYENFEEDWKGMLPNPTYNALLKAVGVKGEAARKIAPTFKGLKIPLDKAAEIFENIVIPREENKTIKTFPGCETLHPDAFGALVSLIYNRGNLINNTDKRKEMLGLYNLFRRGTPFNLREIANLVEAQKRLWKDVQSSDGDLHDRRIAEAQLIRSTI